MASRSPSNSPTATAILDLSMIKRLYRLENDADVNSLTDIECNWLSNIRPKIPRLLSIDSNLSLFVPQLVNLNLFNNRIRAIGDAFNGLNMLQELNLADNDIEYFDSILLCENLKQLNVEGNRIEHIPSEIVNLTSLEMLKMARNQLSQREEIPFLSTLLHLNNISLLDNPCSCTPYFDEFVIVNIESVIMLNGKEISEMDRLSAEILLKGGDFESGIGKSWSRRLPASNYHSERGIEHAKLHKLATNTIRAIEAVPATLDKNANDTTGSTRNNDIVTTIPAEEIDVEYTPATISSVQRKLTFRSDEAKSDVLHSLEQVDEHSKQVLVKSWLRRRHNVHLVIIANVNSYKDVKNEIAMLNSILLTEQEELKRSRLQHADSVKRRKKTHKLHHSRTHEQDQHEDNIRLRIADLEQKNVTHRELLHSLEKEIETDVHILMDIENTLALMCGKIPHPFDLQHDSDAVLFPMPFVDVINTLREMNFSLVINEDAYFAAKGWSPVRSPLQKSPLPNDRAVLWEYVDENRKMQGPFTSAQMLQWHLAGYLNDDLMIRQCRNNKENVATSETFRPLSSFPYNIFYGQYHSMHEENASNAIHLQKMPARKPTANEFNNDKNDQLLNKASLKGAATIDFAVDSATIAPSYFDRDRASRQLSQHQTTEAKIRSHNGTAVTRMSDDFAGKLEQQLINKMHEVSALDSKKAELIEEIKIAAETKIAVMHERDVMVSERDKAKNQFSTYQHDTLRTQNELALLLQDLVSKEEERNELMAMREILEQVKKEIETLKNERKSAHDELTKLGIENNNLTIQNQQEIDSIRKHRHARSLLENEQQKIEQNISQLRSDADYLVNEVTATKELFEKEKTEKVASGIEKQQLHVRIEQMKKELTTLKHSMEEETNALKARQMLKGNIVIELEELEIKSKQRKLELEEHETYLAEVKLQSETLRLDVTRRKGDVIALQAQKEKLTKEVENIQRRIDSLSSDEDVLKELNKEHSVLIRKVENLSEEERLMKENKMLMEEEIMSLNEHKNLLQNDVLVQSKRKCELMQDVDRMVLLLKKNRDEVHELNNSIDEAKRSLGEVNSSHHEKQRLIELCNAEIKSLKHAESAAKKELKAIEAAIIRSKENMSVHEREHNMVSYTNEQLQASIAAKESTLSELNERKNKLELSISMEQDKKMAYEKENETLSKEISQSSIHLSAIKRESEQVTAMCNAARKDLQQTTNALNAAERDKVLLIELQSNLSKYKFKVQQEEERLNDINQDYSTQNTKLAKLKAEVVDISSQLTKFRNEKVRLEGDIDNKRKEIDEYRTQLDGARRTLKERKDDIEREDRVLTDLRLRNNEMGNEQSSLAEQTSRLGNQISAQKMSLDDLEKGIQTSKTRKQTIEHEINLLESEMESSRLKHDQLNQAINVSRKIENELRSKIQQAEIQLQTTQSRLTSVESEYQTEYTKQNELLLKKLNIINQSVAESQASLSSLQQETKHRKEMLAAEIDAMTRTKLSIESSVHDLRTNALNPAAAEVSRLKEQVNALSNSCESEQEKLTAGRIALSAGQSELDRLQSEIKGCRNEFTALKDNVVTERIVTSQLQQEIAEKREQHHVLSKEIAELQQSVEALRSMKDAIGDAVKSTESMELNTNDVASYYRLKVQELQNDLSKLRHLVILSLQDVDLGIMSYPSSDTESHIKLSDAVPAENEMTASVLLQTIASLKLKVKEQTAELCSIKTRFLKAIGSSNLENSNLVVQIDANSSSPGMDEQLFAYEPVTQPLLALRHLYQESVKSLQNAYQIREQSLNQQVKQLRDEMSARGKEFSNVVENLVVLESPVLAAHSLHASLNGLKAMSLEVAQNIDKLHSVRSVKIDQERYRLVVKEKDSQLKALVNQLESLQREFKESRKAAELLYADKVSKLTDQLAQKERSESALKLALLSSNKHIESLQTRINVVEAKSNSLIKLASVSSSSPAQYLLPSNYINRNPQPLFTSSTSTSVAATPYMSSRLQFNSNTGAINNFAHSSPPMRPTSPAFTFQLHSPVFQRPAEVHQNEGADLDGTAMKPSLHAMPSVAEIIALGAQKTAPMSKVKSSASDLDGDDTNTESFHSEETIPQLQAMIRQAQFQSNSSVKAHSISIPVHDPTSATVASADKKARVSPSPSEESTKASHKGVTNSDKLRMAANSLRSVSPSKYKQPTT